MSAEAIGARRPLGADLRASVVRVARSIGTIGGKIGVLHRGASPALPQANFVAEPITGSIGETDEVGRYQVFVRTVRDAPYKVGNHTYSHIGFEVVRRDVKTGEETIIVQE